MSDQPGSNQEQHHTTPKDEQEPVVDTWYDDEEKKNESSWKKPSLDLCALRNKMEERILKVVPVEVTEHLANSRKELFLAGIALAESGIRKADATVQRARDLNTKQEAQPAE